ncbi:methyltransferase domain-containing protein, partial [Candidatus Poribacteria bacterium]|nr:methyltransferase domain-containing protein [Candidatus Poribacteria bacterium]
MPDTPAPAQVNPRRKREAPPVSRWERNRRHWERTLDAQNLGERDAGAGLRQQLELYRTLDVRWAVRELAPLGGRWLLDLGGGLALAAILFAREEARVIICDVSLPRLRAARRLAREAGVEDRIALVVAKAEALPMAERLMDRV